MAPEEEEIAADNIFVNISSGPLSSEDILVLSSSELLASISEEALVTGLITADLADAESIKKNVQTLDSLQLLVAEVQGEEVPDLADMGQDSIDQIEEDRIDDAIETIGERPISESDSSKDTFEDLADPTFMDKVKMVFESIVLNPIKGRKLSDDMRLKSKLDQLAQEHKQPKSSKASNTYEIFKENTAKSLQRLFSSRKPFLSTRSRSSSRMIITISLVIILIVCAMWYWNFSSNRAERAQLDRLIEEITQDRSQAETKAIYDTEGAKRLLIQVQNKINQLKESDLTEYQSQGEDEQLKLQVLLDQVVNVYREISPTLAFDLSSKRSDVNARGFVSTGESLYAYDKNAIYRLILDEVNMRKITISGSDDFDLSSATFLTQEGALMFLTKNKQLIKYQDDNFSLVQAPSEGFKDAVAIDDYDRRKMLYFLDATGNEIWRYSPENDSYGEPSKKNVGIDISGAVDFGIDGAIYILSRDGKVSKIYGDEQKPFELNGLIHPLEEPTQIFVDLDEDSGNLYILDPSNNRVVVTGKGGNYKSQYIFENIEDLADVYVSYDENVLYVLGSDGKVYKTELRP